MKARGKEAEGYSLDISCGFCRKPDNLGKGFLGHGQGVEAEIEISDQLLLDLVLGVFEAMAKRINFAR